jgi:hypothetical protein
VWDSNKLTIKLQKMNDKCTNISKPVNPALNLADVRGSLPTDDDIIESGFKYFGLNPDLNHNNAQILKMGDYIAGARFVLNFKGNDR